MYVLNTGRQSCYLPKDLPPRSTVYHYYFNWSRDGTLDRRREQAGRKASPTAAVIDTQGVRSAEKRGLRSIRTGSMQDRKSTAKSVMFFVDTQRLLMQAIVHCADVEDRDGGVLLLWTLCGRLPYLEKTGRRQRVSRTDLRRCARQNLVSGQDRDRQTIRAGERLRDAAQALDRRANNRLAQPLPKFGQGLGEPRPHGPHVPVLRLHPHYAPKALQSLIIFRARTLRELFCVVEAKGQPMDEQSQLSIIVPAYNEGARIVNTIHSLLFGLPEGAEVFVVFNGCTDGSDSFLDHYGDPRLQIIKLQRQSKPFAIRAAEEVASKYPRFYVDADVEIKGSDLGMIATALRDNKTELASPRLTMDFSECSYLARAASETWMRLPHFRSEAYQAVLGISREGRSRWGEMPELIADNSFIVSRIEPSRRLIIEEATAIVRPPRNLWSFIRVRIRIEQGRREFQNNKIKFPKALSQRHTLISLLLNTSTSLDAIIYIIAVICALVFLSSGLYTNREWIQDRSSRS